MTGWISIGGQIVLTSSAAFAAGLQTQSLIIVNSDSYIPQRWQGMLFYWAILTYALVMNIWGHRLLPTTNTISGLCEPLTWGYAMLTLPRYPSCSRFRLDSYRLGRHGPQELSLLCLYRVHKLKWLV
jgi:hypothetical protein